MTMYLIFRVMCIVCARLCMYVLKISQIEKFHVLPIIAHAYIRVLCNRIVIIWTNHSVQLANKCKHMPHIHV